MKSGSPSRTTAAHKTHTKNPGLVLSRLPLLSLLLLFLPKLLRGTRDRWVVQVSFIIIYSTGLAPFPRLSAPPHSSQCSYHRIDFLIIKRINPPKMIYTLSCIIFISSVKQEMFMLVCNSRSQNKSKLVRATLMCGAFITFSLAFYIINPCSL